MAHADERMRFRGAAYIVARVRTPGMQQGRLWICSLFPVSALEANAAGTNKERKNMEPLRPSRLT